VSKAWYQLKPDSSGSYVNGTWSSLAPMSLERLYFGSNLLPDGRVFLAGGEYSGPSGASNWTNTGEIYDPVANSWSSIQNFPQSQFGDEQLEQRGDQAAQRPQRRRDLGQAAGRQRPVLRRVR